MQRITPTRSLALASLLALAACGGSAPPPATEPAPPPATEPPPPPPTAPARTAAELAAPDPGAPYPYPMEHFAPFMDGCTDGCVAELMCACLYGRLQWTLSAEDALDGKLTDAQMQTISQTCLVEVPDPGPLPAGCELPPE